MTISRPPTTARARLFELCQGVFDEGRIPHGLRSLSFAVCTCRQSVGFQGMVLKYRELVTAADPQAYLLDLCQRLIDEGAITSRAAARA